MPKKPTSKTNDKTKASPPQNETAQESSQKPRRKGPKIRLTSHKTRSKWFQARSSWPVREAPVNRLVRERNRAQERLAAAAVDAEWECVGPFNVGGRVTSIACHPKHPERIWIGAAGGGVWHSSDAGRTWKSCWNDQEILNIGALAIDERNPDIIYCGTGEEPVVRLLPRRRALSQRRCGQILETACLIERDRNSTRHWRDRNRSF